MLPSTIQEYLDADIQALAERWQRCSPKCWEVAGQHAALTLFHAAARHVPAYADYLGRHGVNAERISSFEDFRRYVPPCDKSNYINQYPLRDMLWNGDMSRATLVNSSSGTAGKSYFWPTASREIAEAATLYEYVLRSDFRIAERSTLLVICFGMGTWIAGAYTYNATQFLNEKKYDFTAVTPGFDKDNTANVIAALGGDFDQIVIAGIPSFVRDFVRSIDLPAEKTRFLLAGEGVTETWRDFVRSQVRSTCPTDVVSLYGSADAGFMGFETSTSIAVRRAITNDETLREQLVGGTRIPMLFQFLPIHRCYETHAGELLITAHRSLPLIRYNLHDQGVVLPADCLQPVIRRLEGGEVDTAGDEGPRNQLPLVAVFGRGKFGATLYGANIHADDVQDVFQDTALADHFTGRFTLETKYDSEQLQQLELHAEVPLGVVDTAELAGRLKRCFVQRVSLTSSEYRKIISEYGEQAHPHISLHVAGEDSKFGTRQVKTN